MSQLMTDSKNKLVGAIIAGGHSRRFGSIDKALVDLCGIPLIEHVYQRLRPQVSKLLLNIPAKSAIAYLDAQQIQDTTDKRDGPLAGVLSALSVAQESGSDWLLICPCDTPFIPPDLGEKLLQRCVEKNAQLGIARTKGWNHPSLSLWHQSLFADLERAVIKESKAGFKQFYPQTNHCFADWQTGTYDPFFNINVPQDVDTAIDIINNNPQLKFNCQDQTTMPPASDKTIHINVAVLTVSDTRRLENDTSGSYLQEQLEAAGHSVADRQICIDDIYQIRALVSKWIADPDIHSIISTGGTGFSGRDSTPEAMKPLFDKTIEGFGELFRQLSHEEIGSSTIQSRALAGVSNDTFIFCLPGSTGACRTGWQGILKEQLDSQHKPCNFITHTRAAKA